MRIGGFEQPDINNSDSMGRIEAKSKEREAISSQVEVFLAKGGKIDKCARHAKGSGISWRATPILTTPDFSTATAAKKMGITERHLIKLIETGRAPQSRLVDGLGRATHRFTGEAISIWMQDHLVEAKQ